MKKEFNKIRNEFLTKIKEKLPKEYENYNLLYEATLQTYLYCVLREIVDKYKDYRVYPELGIYPKPKGKRKGIKSLVVDLAIVKINEDAEGEHILELIEEVLPIELKSKDDINKEINFKECKNDIIKLNSLITKKSFYSREGNRFKKIHNGVFVFISDEPLKEAAIKELRSLKSKNVFIIGFAVSESDVPESEAEMKIEEVNI